MGAGTSSLETDQIGDEIFQFAEQYLEIDDVAKLEKITGMVLSSAGNDKNELYELLKNNKSELERRIRESERVIGHSSSAKSVAKTEKTETADEPANRREELINHFKRLYPTIDSVKVADELLKLSEKELQYVISTPLELKSFVKSCSLDEQKDELVKGPTSEILDSPEQIEKLKQEHLEQLSKPEICEEDVEALMASHMFKRTSLLHPSKANVLTGILMGMEKDNLLQLLVSARALHLTLANVIKGLIEHSKLTKSDITLMQEELGDLIYSVIEKGMAQETACQVTGMLLEMDIVSLHEVLADDFLFKKRLKQALRACKLMKT